jgi:ATP-dependent RNA helicase DDX35
VCRSVLGAVLRDDFARHCAADVYYSDEPVPDFIRATVETCVKLHLTMPPGDILAFLPGSEEIDRAVEDIQVHPSP